MNDTYLNELRRTEWRLSPTGPQARYRVSLTSGETYKLPVDTHEVMIRFGTACVLDGEHEFILPQGETQVMLGLEEGAISSVYDYEPLVFEMVLDADSEASQQLKHQFYERMAAHQQLIEAETMHDKR